jgi:molybdopterin molybdotransferase
MSDASLAMIPYEQALEIVTGAVRPLGAENLSLARAAGRYLSGPVKARRQLPGFEQSVMDGFAVRAADLADASPAGPVTLVVAGEMAAGPVRRLRLGAGRTVKVFTGGRLPLGADAVVMQEHVTCAGDEARFGAQPAVGDHIRRAGEEIRRGDVVLPAGTRVTPPVVGLLAALGLTEVKVVRTPTVTVITMGDELVPPGEPLTAGRIHDANGPALRAALQAVGVSRVRLRRVRDDVGALERSLAAALAASDLVVTVGGASVGDHDHVAAARSTLGVRELFYRVAVKPGKPNIFGLDPRGVPVFGLPGNPVSALVSFHQLVKPLLGVMMGAGVRPGRALPVSLREPVDKKPGRAHWLRGRLVPAQDGLVAELATAQGSHMLSGLATADILAELPAASDHVTTDEVLRAWLIDWDAC